MIRAYARNCRTRNLRFLATFTTSMEHALLVVHTKWYVRKNLRAGEKILLRPVVQR